MSDVTNENVLNEVNESKAEESTGQQENVQLNEDESYLYDEIKNFVKGLENVSLEGIIERVNHIRLLQLIYYIRQNLNETVVDGSLSEVSEEKISAILENMNYHIKYNETMKRWCCNVYLDGGLLVVTDTSKAIAGLRALIFMRNGCCYYNNVELRDTLLKQWAVVRNQDQDAKSDTRSVTDYTEEQAILAAKEIGLDYDEIVKQINAESEEIKKH